MSKNAGSATNNVTHSSFFPSPVSKPARILLLALASLAMLAGLYGRFKGIGVWPLGVDEFYTSRSIDYVLSTGLPRFPCGGFYNRGVLFQYVVAAARELGLSPEFSGRFVSALCSLAVWPAVWLLARRLAGEVGAWLAVIVLALSVWEIEMARFYRMYAPYQAVFAWYLLFYARYAVDKRDAALYGMVLLSLVGVLTWEGGALLGVANILAVVQRSDRGRLTGADWRRAFALAAYLVVLFLMTRDLRGLGVPQTAPAGAIGASARSTAHALAWLSAIKGHPVWAGLFLLPAGAALASAPWICRRPLLPAAALAAALAAAALHAFALTAGLIALLPTLRLVDGQELRARCARLFWASLAAFAVFWVAYVFLSGMPQAQGAKKAALFLFGFPDIFGHMVLPWGRAVPVLSAELGAALCLTYYRALGARTEAAGAEMARAEGARAEVLSAALFNLVLVLVVVAGCVPTDRTETRYTFFLYPLLVVLAVGCVFALARRRRSFAPCAAIVCVLTGFAISGDFQPRHLLQVDSPAINFRVGMSAVRADHYYIHNDVRGIAQWLRANVKPEDLVIDGIPNLDPYYHDFEYFYLGLDEDRYDAYICADGKTERWTGHPVLHGVQALKAVITPGRPAYVTVYRDVEPQLRQAAAGEGWVLTRAWTAADQQTDILRIEALPRG
jgi:dolichyl-phosphate-mannose-protein mannosyltransferase